MTGGGTVGIMAEPERRRRRVRPPSGANSAPAESTTPAGSPAPVPGPPAVPVPTPPPTAPAPTRPAKRPAPTGGSGTEDREAERGLRGLVGSGSSQVSVGAALRARDASRPSAEQLAEADRELTIVRRNWLPREDLPRR
ncbi:hypothetical protein SAMN06264365_10946 [Actinoplanes regularis]|uniref:Uncharacterized protein n=2 Tax=Actinoplanes regularis TaxID=52697 RepID=A0A239B9S1_9ACTN|nr:hypothetical protein Are01nite_43210 [Actinoplanes regularis]SNS04362.1 hypothetical protein SAMN06264365_10946 [Actinoplanes regularis]